MATTVALRAARQRVMSAGAPRAASSLASGQSGHGGAFSAVSGDEPPCTALVAPGRISIKSTHTSLTGHVRTEGSLTFIFEPAAAGLFANADHETYLQVRTRDVSMKEPLATLVTETGLSISCTRVWLKKGSVVKRVSPFTV